MFCFGPGRDSDVRAPPTTEPRTVCGRLMTEGGESNGGGPQYERYLRLLTRREQAPPSMKRYASWKLFSELSGSECTRRAGCNWLVKQSMSGRPYLPMLLAPVSSVKVLSELWRTGVVGRSLPPVSTTAPYLGPDCPPDPGSVCPGRHAAQRGTLGSEVVRARE